MLRNHLGRALGECCVFALPVVKRFATSIDEPGRRPARNASITIAPFSSLRCIARHGLTRFTTSVESGQPQASAAIKRREACCFFEERNSEKLFKKGLEVARPLPFARPKRITELFFGVTSLLSILGADKPSRVLRSDASDSARNTLVYRLQLQHKFTQSFGVLESRRYSYLDLAAGDTSA
jgi:hypothetical protein